MSEIDMDLGVPISKSEIQEKQLLKEEIKRELKRRIGKETIKPPLTKDNKVN